MKKQFKAKGLGTYHRRIHLKRSRLKVHIHEQSLRMLLSILIYSNQTFDIHVVDENYTSNCDFNSNEDYIRKEPIGEQFYFSQANCQWICRLEL